MIRTSSYLALLVVVSGCSQRSPWRIVEAPAPQTTPEVAVVPASMSTDAASTAHLGALVFPVAAADSTRFDDSFDAPRDSGRTHHAIDIMAPRGTAVLSAADGRILRLARTPRGGISLYAADLEDRFVYYYAHLERYHPNLYAGRPILRGDTLGYVGTTGNAPKNVPHLHFQVMRMPPDRKYWAGEPVNPYPLLRQAAGPSPVGR